MIKIILGTMCLIIFGTGLCLASDPSDTNKWGQSVQGVQLLITLTNTSDVIEAGSSITFVAVLKNVSTNVVAVAYTALPSDYSASLTSVTGKTHEIIDSPLIIRLNYSVRLDPGKQDVRIISTGIKKSIEPGDYTLQARRGIYVDNHWFSVKSNLIKVKIK
jgi:hypothetical protein